MKKLLAIVLTIAMLCSSLALGAFAADRIVSQDEATENHYWNFPQGQSWHPVKFTDPSSTVELDIRFDHAESNVGCYGLSNAPSFTMTSVGVTAATLEYAFETGTWYNVKFVSADGSTEIFVNGASVGTVAAEITYYSDNQFYWAADKVSMDNVKVGSQTFDFEGNNDAWNTESSQGQVLIEEIAGAIHNELVAKSENHYWNFPQGQSWHPVKFTDPSSTVELDIRFDHAESNVGCYGLSNAPSFTMTSVGVTAATVPYNFETDTWYNVKFVSADGSTEIFVNGTSVGTVAAEITYYSDNQFYWAADKVSMDNVKVGSQTFDFEGNNDAWNTESSQGQLLIAEVETLRQDLGEYYYNFPQGQSWHPVKFADPSSTVELDIKLDDASSSLGNYNLSNGPFISTNAIGLKNADTSIDHTFDVGTWYNVKFVSANGATEIFVDGVSVGTVAAEITYYDGNQFYWAADKVSMDNVKVGSQTFDFEDGVGTWNDAGSTQGQILKYDLTVAGAATIFDKMGEHGEVGGQAWFIRAEQSDNSVYIDLEGLASKSTEFILDFDLALLPNTSERYTSTFSDQDVKFELWYNVAANRVKVGTKYVGLNNDLVLFDWGDATINNFHRITYEVKSSYGIINLYVDENLVYTCSGVDGTQLWTDRFLGMVWNASAVLDNVKLYDADFNEISTHLDGDNGMSTGDFNSIDLSNPCANGHMVGTSVITTPETCLATGIDTITCPGCGTDYTVTTETLEHVWPNYRNNHNFKSATATADGVRGWYCERNCGTTIQTSMPATSKYEGDIWIYADFEDSRVLTDCLEFLKYDNQYIENGYGVFDVDCTQNYNLISSGTEKCKYDYSISFDFKDVVTFDYDGVDGYGHEFYFWFGGDSGIANCAGYNFDEGYFFIRPFEGNAFDPMITEYEMTNDGKWHTITLRYSMPNEDEAYVALELDGVVMCETEDTWDAYYGLAASAPENESDNVIFRDFGVSAKIDNLVIGSSDFKWLPDYGDANGDGIVSVLDLVYLRYYLAGAYEDADIEFDNADMDGDGIITTADFKALKNVIAGVVAE